MVAVWWRCRPHLGVEGQAGVPGLGKVSVQEVWPSGFGEGQGRMTGADQSVLGRTTRADQLVLGTGQKGRERNRGW